MCAVLSDMIWPYHQQRRSGADLVPQGWWCKFLLYCVLTSWHAVQYLFSWKYACTVCQVRQLTSHKRATQVTVTAWSVLRDRQTDFAGSLNTTASNAPALPLDMFSGHILSDHVHSHTAFLKLPGISSWLLPCVQLYVQFVLLLFFLFKQDV